MSYSVVLGRDFINQSDLSFECTTWAKLENKTMNSLKLDIDDSPILRNF